MQTSAIECKHLEFTADVTEHPWEDGSGVIVDAAVKCTTCGVHYYNARDARADGVFPQADAARRAALDARGAAKRTARDPLAAAIRAVVQELGLTPSGTGSEDLGMLELEAKRLRSGPRMPRHIHMTIEHQPHALNYQTVKEWLDEHPGEFADADRAQMNATGEVWYVQWYPRTPVGFLHVAAATFERAMEIANASDHDDERVHR